MAQIHVTAQEAAEALRQRGYAVLNPRELSRLVEVELTELEAWKPLWEELPRDPHLKDLGSYRARRHGCFVGGAAGGLEAVPHRAHWQSEDYNALHGGMERWFEPLTPTLVETPAWQHLVGGLGTLFSRVRNVDRWYIEAHQFRIDTAEGMGRPTPEGAHRDGVDFVAVILVDRRNVLGGETRVFDADGPDGWRFEMTQPWTALLLDDPRVIHESTPIRPLDPQMIGSRDTLVLTYRQGGFQAPEASLQGAAGP
ncbi:MAG TPA: 2OG-Fe dioxygenase family protein [Myxococcaceae bacterium]|nr:2OG-Fe dioxygenase family protein [Myxococcaceae bacterium]